MPYVDDTSLIAMSHAELYNARAKSTNKDEQDKLAPLEHRAFAREFAQESPVKAAASLPFAIPAYAAAKAMGVTQSRSGASTEQMKQAFLGLFEGLRKPKEDKPKRQERNGINGTMHQNVPAQRRMRHDGSGVVRG